MQRTADDEATKLALAECELHAVRLRLPTSPDSQPIPDATSSYELSLVLC